MATAIIVNCWNPNLTLHNFMHLHIGPFVLPVGLSAGFFFWLLWQHCLWGFSASFESITGQITVTPNSDSNCFTLTAVTLHCHGARFISMTPSLHLVNSPISISVMLEGHNWVSDLPSLQRLHGSMDPLLSLLFYCPSMGEIQPLQRLHVSMELRGSSTKERIHTFWLCCSITKEPLLFIRLCCSTVTEPILILSFHGSLS